MLRAQASVTSVDQSDDELSEKRQLEAERNKNHECLRSEDHRHKAKMDGTAVTVKRQRSATWLLVLRPIGCLLSHSPAANRVAEFFKLHLQKNEFNIKFQFI